MTVALRGELDRQAIEWRRKRDGAIASVTNTEMGIEARIVENGRGGWAVSLWDTDAGLQVPMVKVFADYVDAVLYANRITD